MKRGGAEDCEQRLIRVGRVGRPHGRAGAFAVAEPTTRLELLEPGRRVLVGEREMTIAARRGSAARPLLELEGVRGRDGVAGLVGTELRVPRETLGPLAEGEYLVEDLIGLEVADRGRRVGRVRDVLLLPSVDCLEVEPEDGGAQPLLVPFLREAVRSLDLEAGRVDVDLGFVEVEPREHHGGCAAT